MSRRDSRDPFHDIPEAAPGRDRPGAAGRPSARRAGAALASLALAWLAGMGVTARATSDRPDAEEIVRRWADGPARYLLTTQEDAEVRELTTIPDLARFITKFWKRRDPTPLTLLNENRLVFWTRVRQANLRFHDSAQPGWKSDRGKVFILMGEPDQIESDDVRVFIPDTLTKTELGDRPMGSARSGTIADAGAHDVIRWHYLRVRSKAASPEIIVAFERSERGDWRLSTDPKLLAASYSTASTDPSQDTSFGHPEQRTSMDREHMIEMKAANQALPAQIVINTVSYEHRSAPLDVLNASNTLRDIATMRAGAEAALEGGRAQLDAAESGLGVGSTLFANADLGLESGLPTVSETAIAEVSARDFLSAFTPEPRFEFFRARDGSTFVDIGARIPSGDLVPAGAPTRPSADLRLYARVSSAGDPKNMRFASSEPASGAGAAPVVSSGGRFDVWTGLALRPGRYDVTLALEDAGSGRVGRGEVSVDVPDLSGPGARLSTLILASDLSTENGKLQPAARSSGVFHRSETFALYYEVYGVAENAPFKVTYRFSRAVGEDWAPIGKPFEQPDREQGAQGWSFPLAKWPAGRYRIEVRVTPPVGGGKEAADSAEFQVVA